MSCKPQLGLLFPIVLAAAGRWRAFVAAAIVALLLALASWAAFGTSTWMAFLAGLPSTGTLNFEAGGAGFSKVQSAFGLARLLGASVALAWMIHGTLVALIIIALVRVWRRRVPFDLQAAALATGCLLVTPYLFIYDLAVLAVPVAFLLRFTLAHRLAAVEIAGLIVAGALLLSYIVFTIPVGFLATLIVAALIARRILIASPSGN